MLGLGGGTIIKLLEKKYPQAKITTLEIDPTMIDIAQKHFDIKNSKNLKIIKADAFKWLGEKTKQKYDLILVDIFKGNQLPKKISSHIFLITLHAV